ncbi:MAG TPA: DUF4279 domain-containing protein [Chloroflexota bacterium]|nr:DUF4279 domain-containing protein [Chloroflexota bacterium]
MAEYNPQDPATYGGENGNCCTTWATFRMWGPEVNPDELTVLLGIKPTESRKVGDVRGKRTFDFGMWVLSTKGLGTTNLETHIQVLLDRLDATNTSVRELIASGKFKADIFCFWESPTRNGGPSFSPHLVARIATLGAPLGLDIHVSDEILEPIEYDGKFFFRTI